MKLSAFPMPSLAALLVAFAAAACRNGMAACGPSQKPAIVLTIRDARAQQGAATSTTIVYDRHGDDTLTVVRLSASADPNATVALGNRPGIYDFRVIRAGYADWLLTNQTVRNDGCDPATVSMMIFLQPQP